MGDLSSRTAADVTAVVDAIPVVAVVTMEFSAAEAAAAGSGSFCC